MTSVDVDDLAAREARMFQVIFALAAQHGCTVTIHEESYCIEIDGPEESQVALAQALAESLIWCSDV